MGLVAIVAAEDTETDFQEMMSRITSKKERPFTFHNLNGTAEIKANASGQTIVEAIAAPYNIILREDLAETGKSNLFAIINKSSNWVLIYEQKQLNGQDYSALSWHKLQIRYNKVMCYLTEPPIELPVPDDDPLPIYNDPHSNPNHLHSLESLMAAVITHDEGHIDPSQQQLYSDAKKFMDEFAKQIGFQQETAKTQAMVRNLTSDWLTIPTVINPDHYDITEGEGAPPSIRQIIPDLRTLKDPLDRYRGFEGKGFTAIRKKDEKDAIYAVRVWGTQHPMGSFLISVVYRMEDNKGTFWGFANSIMLDYPFQRPLELAAQMPGVYVTQHGTLEITGSKPKLYSQEDAKKLRRKHEIILHDVIKAFPETAPILGYVSAADIKK